MRLPAALLLLELLPAVAAFYVPGWSIRSYRDGDAIPLSTNKLTSPLTQFPYAYSELPFVCPAKPDGFGAKFGGSRSVGLNLGEVLRGDRIAISDYELKMGEDIECRHLCDRKVDRAGIQRAKQLVKDGNVVEWIVDNLPGATSFVTVDKSRKYYAAGFKLGVFESDENKAYLNNHVTFVLRWRKMEKSNRKVIVAFEVYTKSIEGPLGGKCADSLDNQPMFELDIPREVDENGHTKTEDDGKTLTIPYTYSVYWKEDNSIEWANRWDLYFVNDEDSAHVHWLAIVNSVVIALLLTVVVAIVMLRTLSRDIQNYNDSGPGSDPEAKKAAADADALDADDTLDDTTGWKLVHGDVFRPPHMGGLFAPTIGSGVQLLAVLCALLVLSATGVLNPSYRGGFISFSIFLFVFAGVFSGYFSARIYKTFRGDAWRKNALMTALLFPGFLFTSIFVLNLFVWAQASSTAIPFTTLLALLAMWLGVSLPLVFVGAFFGNRAAAWEHPTRTTQIARQIPAQPWYLKPLAATLLAGLIPFAVIFIELLFVFRSLYADKSSYYYMYGFLALIAGVLFVTVVEISIVSTYFLLCAENYAWWWRSFGVSAGSAVWIFGYSVWYYFTKLAGVRGGVVSAGLFLAYSALACTVYAVLVGTVGFLASYVFVRRIYGAIKAD
ncbi:putative multispanning membrane protein [Geopyxis carbonaria]|nr:putative multispanning membrane protein [Geopyxis carbonaria]